MSDAMRRYRVVASHARSDEGYSISQDDDQDVVCEGIEISSTGDLLCHNKEGETYRLVAAFRNSYWDSVIEVGTETSERR
jgi:hypothetical protein